MGGGEVGRVKGILRGRLALIDPNCGMLGRLVTPRRRILSERSTIGANFTTPSTLSSLPLSSAKWTLDVFGGRGNVLLIPILDVGDVMGAAALGGISGVGDDGAEPCGSAGAGRIGTTLDRSSISFCRIGLDISNPRKLSRLIFVALMLWLRGKVLPPTGGPVGGSDVGSGTFTGIWLVLLFVLKSEAIFCKVEVLLDWADTAAKTG